MAGRGEEDVPEAVSLYYLDVFTLLAFTRVDMSICTAYCPSNQIRIVTMHNLNIGTTPGSGHRIHQKHAQCCACHAT